MDEFRAKSSKDFFWIFSECTDNEIAFCVVPCCFAAENLKKLQILRKNKIPTKSGGYFMSLHVFRLKTCPLVPHPSSGSQIARWPNKNDHSTIKFKDLVGSGKKQVTFDYVTIEEATNYAAEDALITLKLYNQLKPRLISEKRSSVYEKIDKPLILVLSSMEELGIKVNQKYFGIYRFLSLLSFLKNTSTKQL